MTIVDTEQKKYAELWHDVPEYRDYSPGQENVSRFMDIIHPAEGELLIDIGCGTGVAGLDFVRHGLIVCWLDITDAGLLPEVPRNRFIQEPIWSQWNDWKYGHDYGFCCDVMEHVPTEYTMLALDRIISSCHMSWFQIALVPDQFGVAIGQPLHLTVQPFNWWLERIRTLGAIMIARDLCGQALFVVQKRP